MPRSIVQLNNEVCHFRSFFNKIIEVKTCGGEPGVVLKVGIINVLSLFEQENFGKLFIYLKLFMPLSNFRKGICWEQIYVITKGWY